ncbi:MFS transporter [Kitasatospora sp. NPDC088783]|uniref:MFS transporter n=1 Tax=Kitasatospora sp. NPDC088783 TaxID=3364077 RepID=UPI00382FDB04
MTATAPAAAPAPVRPDRLRRDARWLLAGGAADSFGSGLSAAAGTLYFVTMIGLTPAQVTTTMAVGSVFGLLTPVPVGRLADRIGLVRVYTALLLLRGAAAVGYALSTSYGVFSVFLVLTLALETTTFPLQQSLIATRFEGDARRTLLAKIRGVRNAAMGAGAVLAGLALSGGSRTVVVAVLLANGFSFFVLAAVVAGFRRGAALRPPATDPGPTGSGHGVLRDAGFLTLCGLNSLILLHDTLLLVVMPLWAVTVLRLPVVVPGCLMALNTVLSVLLQFLFARSPRLTGATGRCLVVAVTALAAACAVCAPAGPGPLVVRLGLCVLGVVLLTVAENFHFLASWEIAHRLSPEARYGEYMGAFNTGAAAQNIVGPLLGSGVVLASGAVGWLALGAVVSIAGAGFGVLSGRLARARTP